MSPVTPSPAASPTPRLDALLAADPDLVDRIFEYCVQLVPEIAGRRAEITEALREEFGGERASVRRRDAKENIAQNVLRLFNGRNATEVARELKIGRASVYRYLRQAAKG